ncbi:MAG: ABC transporter substrate-binding protein [Thermoprotei archaeon]|nr:MAG: ABC transporter substrate-binding protein [Thermoprotei archaeon]
MREVAEIAARSLLISGLATLLAVSWSVPAAAVLASSRSRAARAVLAFLNAMIGLPTVLVGLLFYLLLSGAGPLGFLQLLYTPAAVSLGQAFLVTPLLVSLVAEHLGRVRESVTELALSLGATRLQAAATVMREAAPQILSSALVAFNRAVGELGVALLVGGNIRGLTRVMTTAIALEVEKGEFEFALALGGVLLLVNVAVTLAVRALGRVE